MARASKFYDRLMKRGIAVTLRREQGKDIDAACGQLRMSREQKVN
jgi:adenine C2-methylase RlmN of 23S rRNA A2503 and tRNA A37